MNAPYATAAETASAMRPATEQETWLNTQLDRLAPHRHEQGNDAAYVQALEKLVLELRVAQPVVSEPVATFQGKFLCKAWGETDFPAVAIADGMNEVCAFLISQWLGSTDATNDDGTNKLDEAMRDMRDTWDFEGEAWEWHLNFEIGGISVQKVAYAAAQPAPKLVPLTDAQLREVMETVDFTYQPTKFARAIEAAHGITGGQQP